MTLSSTAPVVFVNGELSSEISVFDRAYQFGDGLFETITLHHGIPCLLDLHLKRLQKGLKALGFPLHKLDWIESQIIEKSSAYQSAVLKVIVSRGESKRGYKRPQDAEISVSMIISDSPVKNHTELPSSVRLLVCSTPVGINPHLAGIKHLNRLEQVLARAEWNDEQYFDGIMLDINKNVIETTSANIFFYTKQKLFTPGLLNCGIEGTVRQLVMDLCARLDIECHVSSFSLNDVLQAEAVFITNSVYGLVPVAAIDKKSYDENDWPAALYQEVMKNVFS